MKRILVPVDFSEYSVEALKVAAQIARKNNFEIILLHLLELPHQATDAFGNGNSIPEIIFFKNKKSNKKRTQRRKSRKIDIKKPAHMSRFLLF